MLRVASKSSANILAAAPTANQLTSRSINVSVALEKMNRGKWVNRRIVHAKKLSKKNHSSYALTNQPPTGLTPYGIGRGERADRKQEILYPKEIVEHLNRYVVGQEDAKKCLAVAVYQHYKRLENNRRVMEDWAVKNYVDGTKRAMEEKKKQKKQNPENEDEYFPEFIQKSQRQIVKDLEERDEILLEKSNMVLLGASGTGKTFITQKLGEILDVPIVICDCTTLTQAGYVGDDVDTVIQKLLVKAGGNVDKCEQGIVFLDEFDKIYTSSDPLHTSGNRDVSGKGVQQALLKLVEGTTVKVKDPLAPNSRITVDTTNILFIASGAFSNIEHIIARRMDKRSLGFSAKPTSKDSDHATPAEKLKDEDEEIVSKARDEMIKKCDQGDLISFGMIPEIVGRFPVIVPFHCLNKEHLISVLTEPRGSLMAQTKKFFENENVELRFSPEALNSIVEMAVKRKTGARALKSIVEKAVMNAKYEIPGSNVTCVEITDKNLEDNSFKIIRPTHEIGKENKD